MFDPAKAQKIYITVISGEELMDLLPLSRIPFIRIHRQTPCLSSADEDRTGSRLCINSDITDTFSFTSGLKADGMTNSGSDPGFVENWIDGCTEKAPVCSLSDRCCKLLATGIQIDQINITI